ncbi:hypothetical protein RhiirA4_550144 [Rhizophagus irregularis]|uniref:Uncharacterized protein n=1 Tax=Rhizophagus irregularis TaxID=588596 RepID=A0A2I1HIQ0_9GLOM|nr:hypothetical protein RhiirA4_550144 [Rhizophagus irregularis]
MQNDYCNILPYIKKFIMKEKRVKYLAIKSFDNIDLSTLEDEVNEFYLYNIKVLNFCELYLAIGAYEFAESLNNSKLTKTPLRYWRTVLLQAPNLAVFACRLHQTQQLRKGCGHLLSKKTKGSLNIYNELNVDINDDDVSDEDNMDVDELIIYE